jgi:protein involved in polysaccharide export with SLBB domain
LLKQTDGQQSGLDEGLVSGGTRDRPPQRSSVGGYTVRTFNLHLFSLSQSRITPPSTAQRIPVTKLLLGGWFCLELLSLGLTWSLGSAIAQNLTDRAPEYHIRSGDRLSIKFPYHAELNEPTLVVRPDGQITLTHIGDVHAVGLTVPQLKAQLEKAYSEVLVNPVISVNLTEFVMARVFVGGQVTKAGSYELRAGETLMKAVILAGGFTNDANRRLVMHARPMGNGKLRVTQHDALAMLANSKEAYDFPLQDGDYIFVPDSKLSKISRVMEAFRSVIPGGGVFY